MSGSSMVPSSSNQVMPRRLEGADPFLVLRREMDRVFDDVFRNFGLPIPPLFSSGRAQPVMLTPQMDVSETDREIRLTAELPGLDENNVEVILDDDILTIRGEKKTEREDKDRNYRVMERAVGSFSRSLRLPFKVDPNQMQATVKNGVLSVVIPKPQELQEKVHRIDVKRQEDSGSG